MRPQSSSVVTPVGIREFYITFQFSRSVERRRNRDSNQTAVTFRQLRSLPDFAKNKFVRQFAEMRDQRINVNFSQILHSLRCEKYDYRKAISYDQKLSACKST